MPEKRREISDDDIERLEASFPHASGVAFAEARGVVLASGQSLLQSESGAIYEIFPDGRREFVKAIEPPTDVTPGRKISLK